MTAKRFSSWRALVAVLLGAGIAQPWGADGAAAQEKGPPPTYEQLVEQGTALAEKLCSSCHLMDGAKAPTINASVPPFKVIANVSGQTAERLRNVMILPHSGMPDVRLSNPEIDRLTAYIDSLRAEAAGPPLVPRRSHGAKPQYPDPS